MEFNATFIVSLVSFIVFVFIMNWILYKPIGDIVEKRKKFIDENYNEAKNNSEKSETVLKEREDKLGLAKQKAQKNYSDAVNTANNKKNNLLHSAKEQSANEVEQKTNGYNEESRKAQEILRGDVVNFAKMISGKFIDSSEEIEKDLIDKVMQG